MEWNGCECEEDLFGMETVVFMYGCLAFGEKRRNRRKEEEEEGKKA